MPDRMWQAARRTRMSTKPTDLQAEITYLYNAALIPAYVEVSEGFSFEQAGHLIQVLVRGLAAPKISHSVPKDWWQAFKERCHDSR